ncbi:hypothetical protein ANN_21332 [Periplaneta americana]|uniref:Uncharacterized protein n=1 Tax=Periplaneta americana TaxID=6978 RepID=A0ABQ8SF02_PERAM|nr:hypothetical protein ANN_21332 [Periplaneta americana]
MSSDIKDGSAKDRKNEGEISQTSARSWNNSSKSTGIRPSERELLRRRLHVPTLAVDGRLILSSCVPTSVLANTIKAVFNKDQQRPTAYEIHQWLEESINVREDELDTLQLVSKQNAVYIKFNNQLSYEKHLQLHTGTSTIQLMNGATTTVNITAGEFDTTTVRILNVPPEVSNDRIMHVLQTYGKVQEIINEKWSKNIDFRLILVLD